MMQSLSFFPLQTLRFTIRARQTILLPHFPGSALRSLFGDPLKRIACLLAEKVACDSCLIRKACAYAYLFETSIENQDKDKEDFPRPYVINPSPVPDGGISRGNCYQFEIVLIGNSVNFARFVIDAIRIAGEVDGLGSKRGKFDLLTVASISQSGEQIIYPGILKYVPDDRGQNRYISICSEIDISFETPFRTKVNKRYLNKPPSFQILIKRIRDRVTDLWKGYCSDTTINFPEDLLEKAAQIELIDSNMFWKDPERDRYSTLQGDYMKTGGMVDGATYQGDITPFLQLLRLAERINVGKLSTMGLGKIHLECR